MVKAVYGKEPQRRHIEEKEIMLQTKWRDSKSASFIITLSAELPKNTCDILRSNIR